MFEHDRFRDWPPFRLSDQLVNATPPQDGRLIFRGFPTDQSGIDFDTYRIRLQPVILEGERVGAVPRAHCHKVKLHDVSVCSTLDGFSGSPVFWISDHEAPKEYYFVGVLIKGTHSSKTAYYVDGGWFTIGPHGPLNPDQARARALEILACAKKGIDPRDADARREAEPSMADLGRRFLEEYVPVHCKPSTGKSTFRSVKLFVGPRDRGAAGSRGAAQGHCRPASRPAGQAYQANRTLGVLSQDVFARRSLGLAPRRSPIPAGMSSATRNTSGSGSCRRKRPSDWVRSCARPRKRCPRPWLPSACFC